MNILCVGDVVGKAGRQVIEATIEDLKNEFQLDCVIVNAENAAGGSGLTERIANQFFRMGCDVLTMGDHVWDRPDFLPYLDEGHPIIRPANIPDGAPGKGWFIVKTASGRRVCVISLMGRVFLKYYSDCPFRVFDKIYDQVKDECDVIVVDFHAEATSEKVAFGWYVDGRVSVVVGTHTHIQTADERILPKGTAYITDLGMTGPYDSVIGQKTEKIIERFLTSLPNRFEVAKDNSILCGAVITIDNSNGQAQAITRIQRSAS